MNERLGRRQSGRARCGMALLLTVFASPVLAQGSGNAVGMPTADNTAPPPIGAAAQPVSMVDGNFLENAISANLSTMMGAQLAQQRVTQQRAAQQQAQTDQLRDMAATLVRNHTQLAQQLQILARTSGLQVPLTTDQQTNQGMTALQRAQGRDFDRAFLAQQDALLSRSVAQYQQEIKDGNNGPLRQYAQQTVPMLQSELNQIRQIKP